MGNPLEIDPHGKNPHLSGSKLDAGKNRVDLVLGDFANALWQVAQVGTFGADKYTEHGWLNVPDGLNRYADAQLRHFLKSKQGEYSDPESGLPHAAHEAWNALAKLELLLRSKE